MANSIIEKFCFERNYNLLKILHHNPDKDSFVILVTPNDSDKEYVVKILGTRTPDYIKKTFQTEINFYKQNSGSFITQLIECNENFLVLEFFNGMPLTQFIKKKFMYKQNKQELELLLTQCSLLFDWFYGLGKGLFLTQKKNDNLIIQTMLDRIGNLLTSGPEYTKPLGFESFILRQIVKLLIPKIEQTLTKIVKAWNKNNAKILSDYGHYDVHCENILASENFLVDENKIKLIDFGNFRSPGIWISDLMYFYATFYASLHSKKKIQLKIKKYAYNYIIKKEPNLDVPYTYKLLEVFFISGEVNSRFRLEDKGFKIKLALQLILSIIRL